MACISLGKIDKSLIVILVGCVICFLNRLLNKIKYGKILFENLLLINICMALSRFLTIIPFIILVIRSRRKNKKLEIELPTISKSFEYYDKVKEARKGKWIYILLSAFIFLILSICLTRSFKIKTNAWIWYILFASIFYYLIFKVRLYRHHYLSIVLIILLGLAIDLSTQNLQTEIVGDPINLVLKFVKQILFSLYNVIAKYVMEKKHVSVYEFSFYVGLFNLVVFLIFSIFDYYFLKWTPFKEYFNNFNYKHLLIALGVIFSQLGINITSLFAAKYNSPCHVFIIFVFGQIAYYIDFSGLFPLVVVLLIIILFLSLIFNEIIEINFCKLSYNTKRNISNRAEVDTLLKNDNSSETDIKRKNENDNQSEDNKEKSEKDEDSIKEMDNVIIEDENYYFRI